MTIIWGHNLSERDQQLHREKQQHEPDTDQAPDEWASDTWETDDGDE